MTGNAVGSGHRLQRRPFRLAQHAELTRTAGDERAAPGGIDDARYGSFEDEARAPLQRISQRYGRQEGFGVGMIGWGTYFCSRAAFHHLSQARHHHLICQIAVDD